ncbi:aspartate/methionine/tyrosine aminotransferase [Anaerosolibacter carboniphilus]|uniref:Aminotransferase n=1 Tax=Anaerosolibacter carboniphilus TaxID=1417629 RepID=A0A841L646_9FIRM|nr:pyridoxal phosphate-dependent aminotransferase [Anaerosolibacter carboniphilus]MBB6218562.1 aspartate/methionine/tyrosine aminotransferase [Anaerosolibacter carboniphilus]
MKHRFLAKRYLKNTTTAMGATADLVNRYDDLINLSLGDPDYITDKLVIDGAFADAHKGHTRYTDPQGQMELREEISKFYREQHGYEVDPNHIMVVVGACHGMYLVLEAILDDGDEVIVPAPYFTPYDHQIGLAGGKPVILETYEEDGFQINIERMKSLITNRTKAIILNTPNNPTGACLSHQTLKAVAKVAMEHDLIVIGDDVYGAFSFSEPFKPMTAFEGMTDRTITIGSFSKDYAMTGWRIGYVIGPDFLVSCIRDINEGVCFSAPSISQRAAVHAIRNREKIQPEMIKEYKKRVYYAYDRINGIPNMSMIAPQGSFYLFVNIKKTGFSSEEVSKKLLEEAHVLVIPGNAFGQCGEGYVRIACTVGVEKLKEAFDRIEKMKIFA